MPDGAVGESREAKDSGPSPLFIAVGGLMGSGRTSTLLRLAAAAIERGLRVWIMSPDVGPQLDAASVCRACGRVPGAGGGVTAWVTGPAPATFFAAFDKVPSGQRPDVVLAEPQSHCIDRVMDAIAPLGEILGGPLRVGAYVAVVDPARAHSALGDVNAGVMNKARFLYRTRQNEADVVALNKTDMLTAEQCAGMLQLIAAHFSRGRVFAVSAHNGAGFDALVEAVLSAEK